MLTLILIVNFQARLTHELESQTQEAASSGAEVDEHAVTRRVLGERHDQERAVGRKLKGVGSSTSSTAASHTHFTPGSSSVAPSYEELATARAKSQMYKQSLDAMESNMAHLVAQLQCRMSDLHFSVPYPQYPQPDPNVEEEDENLADD